MSAIVCGKRSSIFEDLPSSPPVSKRIRCSFSSPVRFSPPRPTTGSPFNLSSSPSHLSALDYLSAHFPDMDKQSHRTTITTILCQSLQQQCLSSSQWVLSTADTGFPLCAVFGATKLWQLQKVLDACKMELNPEIIADIDKHLSLVHGG